jgi:division protein CdvB (Snf7/Vps24/ESCRT-III family)
LLAKQLLRLRGSETRLKTSQVQLRGAATTITAAAATASVARGVAAAGRAMGAVNTAVKAQGGAAAIAEFAKASAQLDFSAEAMGDVMDDLLGTAGDAEEADELVSAVLDEIGCDVNAQLGAAPVPRAAPRQAEAEATEDDAADQELQRRLAALRAA